MNLLSLAWHPRLIFTSGAPCAVQRIQGCAYLRLLFPVGEEDQTRYLVFFVDATAAFAAEVAKFDEKNELLRHILDLSADGLQVVNSDSIITLVNKSFEEIHRVSAERVVGQHVTRVIENTRMHIVAKTGIAETGDVQRIGERRVVVSRLPILKEGKCVGAVARSCSSSLKRLTVWLNELNT